MGLGPGHISGFSGVLRVSSFGASWVRRLVGLRVGVGGCCLFLGLTCLASRVSAGRGFEVWAV